MNLIDHVSITVRNLERSKLFYKAVMAALGAQVAYEDNDAIGFGERNSVTENGHTYFSVFQSSASAADPRRHWCFRANSIKQVFKFYEAGIAAGGKDCGSPGFREYHSGYYAAFVLDPEDNKIEAVFHGAKA